MILTSINITVWARILRDVPLMELLRPRNSADIHITSDVIWLFQISKIKFGKILAQFMNVEYEQLLVSFQPATGS